MLQSGNVHPETQGTAVFRLGKELSPTGMEELVLTNANLLPAR